MGIHSRTRIKLAERASWCCAWCGQKTRRDMGWQNSATIEHVTPVSEGGSNRLENLMSACARCNRLRGTQPVHKFSVVAQQFEPDRRLITEAQSLERKVNRTQRKQQLTILCGMPTFTYTKVPDAQLNSTERYRKDRTLVKQALKMSRSNPFEPGSRCHRMFERELEKLPQLAPGIWHGVIHKLTTWCSRVYSVCTTWEKPRETGHLQQ